MNVKGTADVCLILEGTYPYVTGGVSTWVHDLLEAQRDLTFHLVALVPRQANLTPRYKIPDNALSVTHVVVQQLPAGVRSVKKFEELFKRLEGPLMCLQSQGGLAELGDILLALAPFKDQLGSRVLLNSPPAWDMLLRMYETTQPESSFLDYFWTWRGLLGGLYSVLLADLPPARLYHAVSTGYAGLLAARAHLETARPALLTEHGIYTTERRIEIAMADWLYEVPSKELNIDLSRRDLKDMWVDTFTSYSRACYEASSKIITLYGGNQQFQMEDGAAQEKLQIVPNGIDYERYSAVERDSAPRPPTVALIGRVVPIKDVKTFIRACAILRDMVPEVQALILGPTDEDVSYFQECESMVNYMALQRTITFAGRVRLEEYLPRIDAIVLTSISEAQPLVILEAGAAGVPTVATDVGSCRELILGTPNEAPSLGAGGAVTALSNPTATAHALAQLLVDQEWHDRCSRAIRERVRTCYNKNKLDRTYRELYETYRYADDTNIRLEGKYSWQESVSSYGS